MVRHDAAVAALANAAHAARAPLLAKPMQAAPAALWRPSRAAAVAPLCAKKKGFSNEAAAQGLKVNSRGKVSSRPGPPPRKQQQQQQPPPQQAADEPPAVAAAAPSAVAPPAPAAPAAALARAPQPSAAAAPAAAEAVSTPQAVVDRMAKRVAAFAIAPVLGGVAALGAFWYLKVGRNSIRRYRCG